MVKRLILMRHAKSSWSSGALGDHDRPLNTRGRRSAPAIGAWLAALGFAPDEVQSSDSTRTRETWAGVASAFAAPPAPRWVPALYLAEPEEMLSALRTARGETVMLIGHNPGCAYFCETILAEPVTHPTAMDFPTAATLVAEFNITDWSKARWHSGKALAFTVPRDLGVD